ncbi:MAG: superoxide dismutase family protein [Bacteroidetes bacterium]|nr:superoxide dismutase family protein [Bacteroidota bacterium]
MKKKKLAVWILLLFLIPVMHVFAQMDMGKMSMGKNVKAICVLYATQGNNVTGIITFTQTDKGVKVVADLQGLTKGKHGFHIHEFGDCSSVDGTSAGGHFNPEGKSHGAPLDMSRHMGDMGNLEADESGKAHLEYTDATIQLNGPNSILGRSVIIHKNEDDLKTQPTGNAGPRVACGVIGAAK